jgi:type IX secretion system PorP/SprF family membrane protein
MKNILFLLAFLAIGLTAQAQQQPHNTQFMYYKMGYNPGYAGSQESACVSCIYRQQWLGLDGAPSMQALSFNMPLSNQRVGAGANLYRHTIGITSMYNLDLAYAYRVRMGRGMLGIGLQGSVRSIENDFQKTTATQDKTQDESIPANAESKFLFNFGAGLYYSSERFYLGASVPRLLENNLDFDSDDVFVSREVQHVYLMGGVSLPVGPAIKLQPQALFKYVGKAPVDFDANLNVIFSDRYIAGITYRVGGDKTNSIGESIDLLIAAQLTNQLMLGMSYDITLSDIKTYGTGSVEVSLHYCLGGPAGDKEYVNPRFF